MCSGQARFSSLLYLHAALSLLLWNVKVYASPAQNGSAGELRGLSDTF